MPQWEDWLSLKLAELGVDADVYGPYVTGILVRVSGGLLAGTPDACAGGHEPARRGANEQRGAPCNPRARVAALTDPSQLELLQEASSLSGVLDPGTADSIAQRWEARMSASSAAADAAAQVRLLCGCLHHVASADATRGCPRQICCRGGCATVRAPLYVLQPFLTCQRSRNVDEAAALRKKAKSEARLLPSLGCFLTTLWMQEAAAEKRRLLAMLDAVASSSDGGSGSEEDDRDESAGGGSYTAEVQHAREELRLRSEQRREAISRAVEREERKKIEHDARAAIRKQAGHANGAAGAKGKSQQKVSQKAKP